MHPPGPHHAHVAQRVPDFSDLLTELVEESLAAFQGAQFAHNLNKFVSPLVRVFVTKIVRLLFIVAQILLNKQTNKQTNETISGRNGCFITARYALARMFTTSPT